MQKTKQSIIKCAKSTYLGGIVDEKDLAALALQERLSVHHDLVDEVGHVALLLKDDAGQIQQHLRQQQLSASTVLRRHQQIRRTFYYLTNKRMVGMKDRTNK